MGPLQHANTFTTSSKCIHHHVRKCLMPRANASTTSGKHVHSLRRMHLPPHPNASAASTERVHHEWRIQGGLGRDSSPPYVHSTITFLVQLASLRIPVRAVVVMPPTQNSRNRDVKSWTGGMHPPPRPNTSAASCKRVHHLG